jgi:thiosulfate dehydrogenase [quinone] large subunit
MPSKWLAFLRVYTGLWFLWLGGSQLFHGFINSFPRLLNDHIHPFGEFYHSFLTRFVVPHSQAIVIGLVVGETLIGLFLILGLLTRLITFIALVITANYFLALARVDSTYMTITLTGIVILLVLAGSAAGRVLGMDASLYRRTLFKYFS